MVRVERGIRATKQANGVRLHGWEQHSFVSSLPIPYASVHISFSPAFDPFPPFRSFAFPFLSPALSQVLLILSRGASRRCKQARGAFGFDRRRSVLPRFSSVGISATMHRLSLSLFFFFSLPSFLLRLVSTYLWFQQVHHVSTCGLSVVSSTWMAFHVSSTPSWWVVHPRWMSTTPPSTGTKGRWADLDRRSKEEETKSIQR